MSCRPGAIELCPKLFHGDVGRLLGGSCGSRAVSRAWKAGSPNAFSRTENRSCPYQRRRAALGASSRAPSSIRAGLARPETLDQYAITVLLLASSAVVLIHVTQVRQQARIAGFQTLDRVAEAAVQLDDRGLVGEAENPVASAVLAPALEDGHRIFVSHDAIQARGTRRAE